MSKQAQYRTLKKSAEMLRKRGTGGDTVLAHINPEEAQYLQQNFGGEINPYTGLPQYGFFRKVGRGFRGIEKALRGPVKFIGPIAGSVVGGMLGGPAGAMAGGAMGGSLNGKGGHFKNALKGAFMGLGHSMLSPMIGRGLGLNPDSFLGRASMANGTGFGGGSGGMGSSIFGVGSSGGGLDSMFGGGSSSAGGSGAAGAGASASAGGSGLFGMGLLDTALLATTIGGQLLGKNKKPREGSPENETLEQATQRNRPAWGPQHAYRPPSGVAPKAYYPPQGYRKTAWKFFPTPEEQEAQLLAATQEMEDPEYDRRYAKGGHVKGYYHGNDGGQSDKIPVDLPEDAYIMDATTVSLLGDGNSMHGAKKIRSFLDGFQKSGITRDEGGHSNVRALVSDSEMKVEPEEVRALGGGSIKKGVKKLDKFRSNLRKHKGVKKFLPPKSKPLTQYLG